MSRRKHRRGRPSSNTPTTKSHNRERYEYKRQLVKLENHAEAGNFYIEPIN